MQTFMNISHMAERIFWSPSCKHSSPTAEPHPLGIFQIRHASVDRLLDRLTDLRFLSIDFLNTFLLTYRVFTTGETVLDALTRVYRNPEYGNLDSSLSLTGGTQEIMYR